MAKIVIIDDDKSLRTVISRIVRSAGHEVLEAPDGKRGVDLVRRSLPDLVITDISMPDQEGMQTIGELRELDAGLPIIVISGEQRVGDYDPLHDARLLGADASLQKPFMMATLLAEVERLLERSAGD
jgi:two-component system chemotaxis response regulator CheY